MPNRDSSFSEEFNELGGTHALSREALDHLFSVTYEELRRLASTVKRSSPDVTLNSTALVNEAWLKLARSREFEALSVLHFKRIAARAMRQLLIESARRRSSEKRGASPRVLQFREELSAPPHTDRDVLALDEALDVLVKLNPRQAMIVESRYFGGLDVAETATLLDVSESTVHREWRVAKAWLSREIRNRSEQ